MGLKNDIRDGILEKRAQSFSSDILKDDLARLNGVQEKFGALQQRHIGAVGNTQDRMRQELG